MIVAIKCSDCDGVLFTCDVPEHITDKQLKNSNLPNYLLTDGYDIFECDCDWEEGND